MDEVNNREHRTTRRKPAVMLTEEAPRLHRIPDTAHTVAFGLARTVPENTPMITFENAQYSVPAHHTPAILSTGAGLENWFLPWAASRPQPNFPGRVAFETAHEFPLAKASTVRSATYSLVHRHDAMRPKTT